MNTLNRIVVVLGVLAWLPTWGAGSEPIGQLKVTGGSVQTVSVTGPHGERSAKSGDSVFEEDRIQTQKGQSATVLLKDKSSIHIGSASSMKIQTTGTESLPVTLADLHSGLAYVKVNPKKTESLRFMLRTKVMTMGVRGTEFVGESKDENSASLHTLDGTVVVAKSAEDLEKPNSVAVPAGQATEATRQGISKPKIFPLRAYLKSLAAENPDLADEIKESAKERRIAARQAARQKSNPAEDELAPKPRRKPIGQKK